MSGITNPTEKYFKDGLWTFDGTVWRPQNQLISYRAAYREAQTNLTPGAGTIALWFAAVPAGEVWVITNYWGKNATAVRGVIEVGIAKGADFFPAVTKLPASATEAVSGAVNIVMSAGCYAGLWFYGVVAGDDLYGSLLGYKFLIAE